MKSVTTFLCTVQLRKFSDKEKIIRQAKKWGTGNCPSLSTPYHDVTFDGG